MSILKQQVHSSPNFESLFIVMTHNSSVNFKLMYFLLWIKRSHQSLNFETFKCSGKNLPSSSYHHYTKNHISQVLEYHEKSKNIKKISIFYQLFRSKKDRISYLWKVQSKNFSVLKKHGIPWWRKHHLTSNFWIKRRPYFPSPNSSKQEPSHNMSFSFCAKFMFL